MDRQGQILFFCEGSPERGFGHVGRCLALANAIRSEYGLHCRFVFRGSDAAQNKITEAGFALTPVTDFNNWQFSDGDAVVLDLLVTLENSFFEKASQAGVLLCTLDDPTPNRLKCDLAFYPPVPQVKELDWTEFAGKLFWDWKYIPLRNEFKTASPKQSKHTIPKLLITMGGSDPKELTLKVLHALKDIPGKWSAKVVAGPMLKSLDKIKDIAVVLKKRVEIISNVSNMAKIMIESDLAVASFGMTAYELAACETAQLLLCLTDDHSRSASALQESGAAISLGRHDHISIEIIRDHLSQLLENEELRKDMSKKAKSLKIGNGASNIARIIMEQLEQKS